MRHSRRSSWLQVRAAGFEATCLCLHALVVFGCANDRISSPSIDVAQACHDLADAECTKISGCEAGFASLYGDCVRGVESGCHDNASAPGSDPTGDQIEACANAVKTGSCGDFLNGRLSCVIRGARGDGETCGSDWQCASGYCYPQRMTSCGTCAAQPKPGDLCSPDVGCGPGLSCIGTTPTCVVRLPVGSSCDPTTSDCELPYECAGGTCRPMLGSGETCGGTEEFCDYITQDLGCDPTTKKCVVPTRAPVGGACSGAAPYVFCVHDATCFHGVCLANAGDGQPCDDVDGPSCEEPDGCTAGTCHLPPAPTCE